MEIIEIKNNYKRALSEAVKVIKAGGLVVFPSDTVYILAVDPTNQKAVNKLLAFKNRWTGKAVSVAVADRKMAENYVILSENAQNIYVNLLPGPFTVVSEGKHKVAAGIEAENGTLGIRIPQNRYIHDLVETLGKPITATSANLSGRTPHYSIEGFLKTLSKKKMGMVDLVVDGGRLVRNKPSTVIDATEPEIKILRRGDLITGKSATLISNSEDETKRIAEFLVNKIEVKKMPIVFGLSGDLGCGKTVFSRAVGRTLGVEENITSPTFVIYNEYLISNQLTVTSYELKKFLHFDLYRISGQYELDEIKFLELFEDNTVACIEWPENMGKDNLKKLKEVVDYKMINFKYIEANTRELVYQL